MPTYHYRAIDKAGRTLDGSLEAVAYAQLVDALKENQLFLVECRESVPPRAAPPRVAAAPPPPKVAATGSEEAVPLALLAVFTNDLAIMVRTAMPILEALEGLASQQGDPKFRAVLWGVAQAVRAGGTISVACSRYPRVFGPIYLGLLESGEASGRLPEMLERIVEHLNFQIELRHKILGAILYPAIVVLGSVGILFFLVLFVLPTFVDVFRQLGVELPIATQLLLALSGNLRACWPFYGAALAGVAALLKSAFAKPRNRSWLDRRKLEVPVAGQVAQYVALTRIFRTLAALLSSGVPILRSLDIVRATAGNAIYHELLGKVCASVTQGHGLAVALRESPYFPPAVANMIANAEKTGTLAEVLDKVGDHYEKETDRVLKAVFTIIEPLLIIFLGVMVVGIAVSVLLPIFDLGGHVE